MGSGMGLLATEGEQGQVSEFQHAIENWPRTTTMLFIREFWREVIVYINVREARYNIRQQLLNNRNLG